MTISVKTVGFKLTGFDDIDDVEYSNTVNAGIQWSCTVPYQVFATWEPTTKYTLSTDTGWTSPDLVCLKTSATTKGGIGKTKLEGQCYVSFLLTAEGLTLPTLHNMTADKIIDAICCLAGNGVAIRTPPPSDAYGETLVTGGVPKFGVTGAPTMLVEEFEVKGGALIEHINRILRDTGYNFKITPNGLTMFPVVTNTGGGYSGLSSGATVNYNLGILYTQIWMRKQSKARSLFGIPIDKPGIGKFDLSPAGLTNPMATIAAGAVGSLAYVAFYTQPGGAGACCGYTAIDPEFALGGANYVGIMKLTGPIVAGTAMSVAWAAEPGNLGKVNLVLIVSGHSPSQWGYDPTFTVTDPGDSLVTDPVTGVVYVQGTTVDPVTGVISVSGDGNGDKAHRQRHYNVSSPLWPTQAYAESIAPLLLSEANKGVMTVTRVLDFDPYAENSLGGGITGDADAPDAVFCSMSWKGGSSMPTMTVTGYVPQGVEGSPSGTL